METEGNSYELEYIVDNKDVGELVETFKDASNVILAFPLYTGCMPGIVKSFIESLKSLCGKQGNPSVGFMVQGGFPEAYQSRFVERYLDEIKKEYKDIKPQEGDEFHSYFLDVERYELTEAEDFFKRLIQCQPEHHDGFWGLARVYKKKGERDKMIYFYDQAIKRAKEFLKENAIDLEVIKMIESEKDDAIKS